MVKSHPQELVLIAARVHLFPFRTQKLSSLAPTILGGRLPGKIGNANTESTRRNPGAFSFFRQLHEMCLGQSTGLSPRHRQSLAYPESQIMPIQRIPGTILVLFLKTLLNVALDFCPKLLLSHWGKGSFLHICPEFFDVSDFCKSFGG